MSRPSGTSPAPRPQTRPRHRGLWPAAFAIAATAAAGGCTPEQLATFRAETGVELDPALLHAPDDPITLGDGRAILADGTITRPNRPSHCDQWRDIVVAAGWPAEVFDQWASAVIYRETGCNPRARSRTGDSGLFQINDIALADMTARPWLWKPALDQIGHVPSQTELYDPTINAIVALNLRAIRGLTPWT